MIQILRRKLLPESRSAFDRALGTYEQAVVMSVKTQSMYMAAIEVVAQSVEMRLRAAPLPRVSENRLSETDYHEMLTRILDGAISLTCADMGNIQLFDPDSQLLKIVVQRGFDRPFLNFFANVHPGESACGAALKRMHAVAVNDVTCSPIFANSPSLEILLEAKVRRVQSVPLVGHNGAILGVISTHFCQPADPSRNSVIESSVNCLDLFSKRVADFMEAWAPKTLLGGASCTPSD